MQQLSQQQKKCCRSTLANNYVWNFTTLSALVVPAPSGLFFGVGGNAGITNQGLNN
jgi:hypothetical protein